VVLQNQPTTTDRSIELGPGAAWLTLEALLDVTRPGAEDHWENFNSTQKIAWKTGTSFGLRDGWAIGSTARFTVGVWVGNANGAGVPGLTGVGVAAPILFDLFNLLPTAEWFSPPNADLKTIIVCADDGFLPDGNCATQAILVPLHSHFAQVTPYHRLLHLDASGTYRVNDHCADLATMRPSGWFVLPPGIEYYYRKKHPTYRPLPPLSGACAKTAAFAAIEPMDLLYPMAGTKVYIPRDLDGQFSRVVCDAIHRDTDATLFWHLDAHYLGSTKNFHQQSIFVGPGVHQLTLVDNKGHRLERKLIVLERAGSHAEQ
jgi:penicillin-binding protein 1C